MSRYHLPSLRVLPLALATRSATRGDLCHRRRHHHRHRLLAWAAGHNGYVGDVSFMTPPAGPNGYGGSLAILQITNGLAGHNG